MEHIKFTYTYEDTDTEKTDEHCIDMEIKASDGLHSYDMCEMFEDFMRAVGFSNQDVVNYFRN